MRVEVFQQPCTEMHLNHDDHRGQQRVLQADELGIEAMTLYEGTKEESQTTII